MKKVFRYNGKDIVEQLAQTIKQIGGDNPVYFCVGSDLAISDSLGPKVGTRLKERSKGAVTVYGVEGNTINAKNVQKAYSAVRFLHPQSTIIVIDASKDKRRGTIRVKDCGLRPGAGVGKNLGRVGNKGIMCCTILPNYDCRKEDFDFWMSCDPDSIFYREPSARLKRLQKLVNDAADTIADAILLASA